MEINQSLHTPIKKLSFSESFIERAERMGFATIQQILDTKPEDLFSRGGFSYTWLEELSDWLMKRNLLSLLQPAGGRNRD